MASTQQPPPSPIDDKKAPLSPTSSLDESSASAAAAASAFGRLPDEIIQQILQATDPDSFASLVLLNSKWRRVSQQAHLYAYHLENCDSYAASHPAIPPDSITHGSLPNLRRLFAREIKRNLFEAYLRPNATTIKLISTSISSSSAPGGEGMQFSASPRGHLLLAYNSSRIYLLDVKSSDLSVKREFKILRRPASACILDDGSLLVVLSTDMQVDLYDLGVSPPRRKQSLILDNPPRAIALSPCGSVLAAAYEGGIEVSSINPGAVTTDRRSVKCDGVDSLAFSCDGTQLLGTTTNSSIPNTVILTAPYYDPGNQMAEDDISALWTTSILFPNTSRDCSHAVLLQESGSVEATWTFTYDRSFETFRAVRIDDLRNGTTYFTGPLPTASSPGPLLPSTLPAANYQGELVSAGFQGQDVWLYGVPEDLEAVPEANHTSSDSSTAPSLHRRNSGLSVRSPARIPEVHGCRVPQWQILCDKFRNTFVSGRKVSQFNGVSNVKWVSGFGQSSLQERLVVTARGVMPPRPITEEDGFDFVDGGRVLILDFDYTTGNGQEKEITIEVGTNEPEVLEEEHRDIDTEVAIVRRRTVAQRKGTRGGMIRSATTANRTADDLLRQATSQASREQDSDDPLVPRPMMAARNIPEPPGSEELEDVSLEEAQEALDAPYAHASPRSGTTLRRAATAAALNRQLNPQTPAAGPVEYRRADGRTEHPHESDADNWVPPPPPYSKDDPGVDLPAFLRHSSIPGARNTATHTHPASAPTTIPPVPAIPPVPPVPQGFATPHAGRPELPKLVTSPGEDHFRHPWDPDNASHPVGSSSASVVLRSEPRIADIVRRPSSSYVSRRNSYTRPGDDDEDIYDVSPVGSPTSISRPQLPEDHASEVMPETTGDQVSAGAYSSATEYTPASSRSMAPTDASYSPAVRRDAPGLAAPHPTANIHPSHEGQDDFVPAIGKLPNAQTWPRAPLATGPSPSTTFAGFPRSAPPGEATQRELIAASIPTAAHPEQTAVLHPRQSSTGAPRPMSGSFQVPRVPVGSRSSHVPPSRRYSEVLGSQFAPPVPDQPLIISTPTGVTGAFDLPGQSTSLGNMVEPVLHAPVPRHPRPMSSAHILRPTAEETDSSNDPHGERGFLDLPDLPPSQLTPTSLRQHASLSRRQSRARRGALKNIKDAKNRGWTGRKKNKKKNEQNVSSTSGWTDVTWASNAPKPQQKEKKCAVM
ncbi:hypothetical protein F4780DRAFT_730743 [Xylariomycetidae sp. FL0641]|nr:hypothetical protein F4780DRAFT_730743 [Xylariomycetidae sp. FL0641]